jgi:L-rhamnose-H+ transport protein
VAGRGKEKDQSGGNVEYGFSLSKGLPICIVAGVLSAFYGFSLDQGAPIAEVAAQHGAGSFKGNVVYLFSNSGAFLTTLVYCSYLHFKDKSWQEFTAVPKLGKNYLLSILTGVLWYGQFFFYGLGHVRMGRYDFTSWAVHMLLLVLISAMTGLLLKEWKGSSTRTMRWLMVSMMVLVASVVMLTYGNYLGGQ